MDFEVIYSARRTVAISVKRDGRVIVRSPYGVSQERILEIVTERESWIQKHKLRFETEAASDAELTDAQIKALKAEARVVLLEKTRHFAAIMGLKYNKITITGAKTRYGSCSSRGNISFSYLLMQKDERAIDYVVVHELAHLVYMNHSKAFYALIEKYLPDYKLRRKLLKETKKT